MQGLGKVCRAQRLVSYKGETAELGVCVGSENPEALTKFNWSGTCIGVYDPKRKIIGKTLRAGQKIVALKEFGFRANGVSSVRKAFQKQFGDQWYTNLAAADAIGMAAEPSVLYDLFLTTANGWYSPGFEPAVKAHLIVHVTGGAIHSKLAEDILFPRNLGAELDELWQPPAIMELCRGWRGMSEVECYETWNAGQGALVVLDEADCDRFISLALEFGINSRVCGTITSRKNPKVEIWSKFAGHSLITFEK
jgi:phosphoribosylaminoimidazole (AIR) synthetase